MVETHDSCTASSQRPSLRWTSCLSMDSKGKSLIDWTISSPTIMCDRETCHDWLTILSAGKLFF